MGSLFSDSPDTVTHVQQNVPQWQEDLSREVINKAKGTLGRPAEQRVYQGERIAPFSNTQQMAFNHARNSYGAYQPELKQTSNMIQKQYDRAPMNIATSANPQGISTSNNPQSIRSNRFTDAAANGLFSQYFDKIYNPAAAELNREASRARNQHALQNAFGGKRFSSNFAHGQAGLEDARLRNLQSLAGNVFNQAMNTFQNEEGRLLNAQQAQAGIHENDLSRALKAQGMQADVYNSDLNRRLQADQLNQAAQLQDKALNLRAAEQMMNNIASKYNMNANDITRLLGVGGMEQKQDQRGIDSAMQKFAEMNNYDRTELEWLMNMIRSNVGGTTRSTQDTPSTDNPALFALSSLPLITSAFK